MSSSTPPSPQTALLHKGKPFSIRTWLYLNREKQAAAEQKRLSTLAKIKKVLKKFFLTQKYPKAYIFGSLTTPGKFRDHSDIDIAIEGVGLEILSLYSQLEHLLKTRIDILDIKDSAGFDKTNWVQIK